MVCGFKSKKANKKQEVINVPKFGASPEEGMEEKESIKVCLTGGMGTGKSLFYYTFFGTLEKFQGTSTQLSGDNDCKKIEIKGKGTFPVSVWDTAGQEKYQAITNIFYKGTQGFFIVFDVTKAQTFKDVEDYWVPQIKKEADISKVSVCLVGNKIDLPDRKVTVQEGEELASKYGFLYRETSALKNIGVTECVYDLVAKIVAKN
jgi:small GTP-binding protein